MRTVVLGVVLGMLAPAPGLWGADSIRFNRDIRPILADNCFACHGPDSAARKSDLRLDHRPLALRGGKSGVPALVPGQAARSELIRRVTTQDPEDLMPPRKSGKSLTVRQIETLKQWVNEGAEYQGHWAFVPPLRSDPPEAPPGTAPPGRVLHPIDAFVRARLAQEGLPFSPQAAPATLLRRVCLDLTGLPPTPAEVSSFEQAAAADFNGAYLDRVERLLASARYGEHMAVRWLDLARYADTSGFQGDPLRTMWRWRDYVIESFNRNKPFDRFTLEQIAGDLLPDASLETRLATGFHRNHRLNTEFGAIDEEWKVENVIDRVETVGATWLALTLGCGRCHDHKYDPVSQREFYRFFAFFNNVPERGVYWDVFGADAVAFEPSLRAPLPADAAKLAALDQNIAEAQTKLGRCEGTTANELSAWDKSGKPWTSVVVLPSNLVVHLPFDGSFQAEFGARTTITTFSHAVTNRPAGGQAATVITNRFTRTNVLRFAEALQIQPPRLGEFSHGPIGQAWRPATPLVISSNVLDQPKATLAFWIGPAAGDGVILSKMGRQKLHPLGLSLSLTNGRVRLELDHEQFDFDATMVPVLLTTTETLPLHEWTHVAVVLDGTRNKRGPRILLNGREAPCDLVYASSRGLPPFRNDQPLLLGGGPGDGFSGWLDDFRIYDRALTERELHLLARLREAGTLSLPAGERSPLQQRLAQAFYRDFISPTYGAAREHLDRLQAERARFEETLPAVMVMQEKPGAPLARILNRGQYDAPGETVAAGIPAALGTLPPGAPASRLGLARWLISPENPLTARVFVNRLWEQFFGLGLVRTSENFGVQGEPPSHPELLDWLATEFVRLRWDVKALVKLIVTSSTYRQASVVKLPEVSIPHPGLARDPENRLLWHGPRFRLPAETIRDQALAVSGLLTEEVGGPSVTPYLPGEKRVLSPDLYRRSVYSFWQRTRFNPSLATFDATSREACTVRRPRTNTPLQALALLNEVTYVESARRLGERMMKHASIPEARLRHGFELALARSPGPEELAVLRRMLDQQLARYRSDPASARKLIAQGASKPEASLPPDELAAHTIVASALLNLDEFVTKE